MSTPFPFLNMDEREALDDILAHEGYSALVKVVNKIARDVEERLLTLSPEAGAEALFHEKLRADGAKRVALQVAKLKDAAKRANASRPPNK